MIVGRSAERSRIDQLLDGARKGQSGSLQIARLVAQGRTNKEAAAALLVSPKTIEAYLGSIYRKLDIRARADLALAMTDERSATAR